MGLAPRVGPIPPRPAHPPPLGSLVPHGGGEEDGTPLGLYKEGDTPFFQYTIISPLLLLPRADSPCSESAPGLEFSSIAGCRFAGVGIRIRLSSAARLVRARREHRLYCTCIISSTHYTCGATSSLEVNRESPSPMIFLHEREVVVLSLCQPRSQERFPLSVFKGMNTDSLRYFTSP